MKISDIKYIFPKLRYSKHTPKTLPFSENYFMRDSVLKNSVPKAIKKEVK